MKLNTTQRRGKTFHVHGLEKQILLKCQYYPKQSTIQCNPYQNTKSIFHRARIVLKFVQNHRRPRVAKAIFKKKSKAGGITIPDFKLYFKTVVIKTVWHKKQTHRSMKYNRKPINESTNIWTINLQQSRKRYPIGKDSLFNKGCWENGQQHSK